MFCPQCGKQANAAQKLCAGCGAALDPSATLAAGPRHAPLDASSVYASLGRRLLAYLIDYVLYIVLLLLVVTIAGAGRYPGLLLVWLLVVWLYKAGMESSKHQATLGKLALNIQVSTEDGERLSFPHATGRMVAYLISNSIALISFLIAAVTSRRQSLHDLIVSTVVVHKGLTPQEIATAPPASGGAGAALIVVVAGFIGIAIIGILAAIAIPAYQDYTIRAQVTEGLVLARSFETQIAQAAANGVDVRSASAQSLGINSSSAGHYVQSVAVDNGAVVITYGGAANSLIQGQKLVLYPVKVNGDSIAWACGYRELDGTRLDAPRLESATTDIAEKFLPQYCRR
jgi:uncharacterized RDD family membrane protein YckC